MINPARERAAAQHKFWNDCVNLRYRCMALRRTFHTKILSEKSLLAKIYLPLYDPDAKRPKIEAWCKLVDNLIIKHGFSQQIALMKAVTCLKGRAKRWADSNAYKYHDWATFHDALVNRFTANRYLHAIIKHGYYCSDYAFTYEQYVREGWKLYSESLPNAPVDFLIAAVVNGIKPELYQEFVIRARPKTYEDLVKAVKDFRKPVQ